MTKPGAMLRRSATALFAVAVLAIHVPSNALAFGGHGGGGGFHGGGMGGFHAGAGAFHGGMGAFHGGGAGAFHGGVGGFHGSAGGFNGGFVGPRGGTFGSRFAGHRPGFHRFDHRFVRRHFFAPGFAGLGFWAYSDWDDGCYVWTPYGYRWVYY